MSVGKKKKNRLLVGKSQKHSGPVSRRWPRNSKPWVYHFYALNSLGSLKTANRSVILLISTKMTSTPWSPEGPACPRQLMPDICRWSSNDLFCHHMYAHICYSFKKRYPPSTACQRLFSTQRYSNHKSEAVPALIQLGSNGWDRCMKTKFLVDFQAFQYFARK